MGGSVERKERGLMSILKTSSMNVEHSERTRNVFHQAIIFFPFGESGLRRFGVHIASVADPFPFHWYGCRLRISLGIGGESVDCLEKRLANVVLLRRWESDTANPYRTFGFWI